MSSLDLAAVQQQVAQQSVRRSSPFYVNWLPSLPWIHRSSWWATAPRPKCKNLALTDIRFDSMGNSLGRIGDGPRILLYDSHIDTVGIGDPGEWQWDPFAGKVENGRFYARGACDEKGSTPGMIYGLAIAHELGLLEGFTAYYFGNMEEWCDGIAGHALVEHEGIRPDFVVIGEPTKMQVYRGHKGRVEMQVVAKGRSAHAACNHLGDNAIYKLLPIIEGISKLEPELGDDPFLGPWQDYRHRYEGRDAEHQRRPQRGHCLCRSPSDLWRKCREPPSSRCVI